MPDAHAKTAPSALETFDLCPFFEDDRTDDNRDAADEGTMLHDAVEGTIKRIISGGHRTTPWEIVNKEPIWPDNIQLDDEQAGILLNAVKHAHQQLLLMGEHAEVHLELRVFMYGITWGTADLIIKHDSVVRLRDWKFGRRKVSPPGCNLQVYAYVLGVFAKFPDVTVVNAALYQPRLDDETEAFTFIRSQVPFLTEKVASIVVRREAAARGDLPETEYKVCEACEFCTAKTHCPRINEWVVQTLENADDAAIRELTFPDSLETSQERGDAMLALQLIKDWAEQMKKLYYQVAKDGLEFDGYAPINRAGNKSIPAASRIKAFSAVLNACHPKGEETMRKILTDGVYDKLLSAVDLTIGKLPVLAAKAVSKLIVKGDDVFYLKRKDA